MVGIGFRCYKRLMKKVLVALDGSPRQQGVLDAAIALARKAGAKVVLFRSVGIPKDLPAEAYSVSPEEIPALLERLALRDLEKLAANVPAELRDKVRVLVGTPWQSIDHAAREEDVDLVVVGSHGYGTLDRVLGTTAAKVVNHADRAVLVVRAPERLTTP
jgi:nucleotide-binding universal stress UspA family protein